MSKAPPKVIHPVGFEFSFTIPLMVRKNTSHRAGLRRTKQKLHATLNLSASSRGFRQYMQAFAQDHELPEKVDYGRWGVEIVTYWGRQRHLKNEHGEAESFPFGDIDAPITPLLDALTHGAHVFDDDVRIGPATLDREVDPDYPRIEVRFKRWA